MNIVKNIRKVVNFLLGETVEKPIYISESTAILPKSGALVTIAKVRRS